MGEAYRSRVYTERPEYADLDAPEKFQAIMGIIMTRLKQHPKAICSYSGGSDSDILIDLITRTREILPSLPPVKYVFFNSGLEMQATKDHVKEISKKYGVEIMEARPKVNIVQAAAAARSRTRRLTISKKSSLMSRMLSRQRGIFSGIVTDTAKNTTNTSNEETKRKVSRGK